LVDGELNKKLPTSNKIIGIDLGIKSFITTSDNEIIENLKLKRTNQKKLNRLHRDLSRKAKGSNNRNKQRIKLAKYYEKLNNIKENYLHHVTNKLLNDNQVIVIEDLNVSGMMKNHKLARSIQELSLHRFKSMLEYKAQWYGRDLVMIDRFYPSSKLCNICNHKNNSLSLSDREWKCINCGHKHDRDHNAALNILKEGERLLNNKIPCRTGKLTLMETLPIGESLK
jgi:putative transposase